MTNLVQQSRECLRMIVRNLTYGSTIFVPCLSKQTWLHCLNGNKLDRQRVQMNGPDVSPHFVSLSVSVSESHCAFMSHSG